MDKQIYRNGESITNMWKRHPCCHWCGIDTTLHVGEFPLGVSPEENVATRDHIFHKIKDKDFRKADQKRNGGRSTVVLACYKCNHKRGSNHDEEST